MPRDNKAIPRDGTAIISTVLCIKLYIADISLFHVSTLIIIKTFFIKQIHGVFLHHLLIRLFGAIFTVYLFLHNKFVTFFNKQFFYFSMFITVLLYLSLGKCLNQLGLTY